MKKLLLLIPALLLMLSPVVFMSCSDDPAEEPQILLPNTEGLYIFGTNTIAESPTDPNAKMSRAILDPGKGALVENMEGVWGKFLYIGANSKIQFAEVVDEVGAVYGATDGGSFDSASVVGNIVEKDKVYHGEFLADGPAINITEEGLYYAFANTNTGLFIIMKVKANMIGDATLLQWAKGTNLPLKSTSKTQTVFEGTNIQLKGSSGYRYRFNDGWHVYHDNNIVTMSSLGVESYGESWDSGINDVGFFLENIPHKEDGIFTITITYDAALGTWEESKVKTGNVIVDHTNTQMGLFGNAYVTAPEDTATWTSGEDGYGLHKPVKAGNVYTWNWEDAQLIEGREFIFLQDGAWGGLQIDYLGAAVSGEAVTNEDIVDAVSVGGEYHNFFVSETTGYDITLVVNSETNARTITITRH